MTWKIVLVTVLSLALAGPAVAQQPQAPAAIPSVTLPAELDRVLRDYEKAWAAKDAAGLSRLFAEDGFILRPGGPPVRGRAAIEEAYKGHGGPLHLRALAFSHADSVGYIIGAYAEKAGAPDDGKFILTLRHEQGRWLITADMDNGNTPPRRPSPPPPGS